MKIEENKIDFKFLNFAMYMIFAVIVYYVLDNLGIMSKIFEALAALIPVFIGIMLCWIIKPLKRFLCKLGIRKNVSAFLSLVIVFGIIIGLFSVIIPIFIEQFSAFIKELPSLYNKLIGVINPILKSKFGLENGLSSFQDFISSEFIGKYAKLIVDYSITTVQSVINIIVAIATVIIVAFFMVKDVDIFKDRLFSMLSKNSTNLKRYKLLVDIEEMTMSYVKGNIIDGLIVGILVTIVCSILGIKYAVVFGLFSALFNLVPYIGAIISELIVAIYAFTTGGPIFAIITFACLLSVQMVDANILQPNIIAKSVDLHPVVVISGLVVFELLFGVVGMLIAMPVLAAIKLILEYKFNIQFDEFIEEEKKVKKRVKRTVNNGK